MDVVLAGLIGFAFAGIATVATCFIMMARSDMRKWLGYANIVDIMFTVFMLYIYHDTFSGVVSASIAGIVMSGSLTIMRKAMGYKKLKITFGRKWLILPTVSATWVYYEPKWKKAFANV